MDTRLDEAYRVLGIGADSDRETVTRAYRLHARANHPDVSPAPDAAERFGAVTDAYRLLVGLPDSGQHPRQPPGDGPVPEHVFRPAAPLGDDHSGAFAGPRSNSRSGTDSGPLFLRVSPVVTARPGRRPPIVAGPVMVHGVASDARGKSGHA